MNKELFTQYEEIQMAIKELEQQRDQLKPLLVEHIPEDSVVKTDNGSFTIKRRNKWTYSSPLQELEADLKDKQKEERQSGIATEVPGEPYVEWRQNKD